MTATGQIALLISDVDGTLVTAAKVLTPRTIQAVQGLAERGISFAITSGRPPRGMAMLAAPLALRTPLAGFNGGIFARPDMTTVEAHTLAPDVARLAVDTLLSHGVDAWVYTAQEWRLRDPAAPHAAHEAETIGFAPTVIADFAVLPDGIGKIVGVTGDPERLARGAEAVHAAIGDRASASCSQAYFLDVTHPLANKGAVVHAFSKLLSVPVSQIATIGDGANDVLMFHEAAFSIAMGNASPAVKREAKAVTASNEDDGFARAIEEHFLGGPR